MILSRNARSAVAATTVVLTSLLTAATASADWPMFRHDAKRTATASSAPAFLTSPTAYWKYYLGGSISSSQLLYDSSAKEVLYISAGKLISKYPDDTFRWETPVIGASRLFGIADVNGDGTRDVIIGSQNHIFIIAATNGATLGGKVEWYSDDAQFGASPSAWIADFNSDGNPDVFASECTCCGTSVPTSGGGMWFFDKGFGNKAPAWTPPQPDCGGAIHVADFNGDNVPDIGLFSNNKLNLIQGRDGMVLGAAATFPTIAGITNPYLTLSSCLSANIDGRPGDESVCFENGFFGGSNGGRRVFAYTYDATKTPTVQLLWNNEAADDANDQLTSNTRSLVDLDHDGKFEVVATFTHLGSDRTEIWDAATGVELTAIDGQLLKASVDITGDLKSTLITHGAAGFSAYSFSRTGSPMLARRWQLPDEYTDVAYARDPSSPGLQSVPVAIDLDGDQKNELVLYRKVTAGSPKPAIVALKADQMATPTVYATYEMDPGLTFLTADAYTGVTRPYKQLLTARSDGFLVILDNMLMPTNNFADSEFPLPGLRIGGALPSDSSGFIAPSLDGTRDTIIVRDSRGYLVSLDPSSANLVVPPKIGWQLQYAFAPTAVPHLDGNKPGIAVYLPPPPSSPPGTPSRLRALHADGTQIWENTIPFNAGLDIVPGDVNNDGVPDLLVGSIDGKMNQGHYAMRNGANGNPLWANDFVTSTAGYWNHASMGDWNGDGTVDVLVSNWGDALPRVLDGANGKQLTVGVSSGYSATYTISDVDGDGIEDYTAQNMYTPSRTYKHDLMTTLWTGSDDDRPYVFGARAACDQGISVWVEGSSKIPGQVRFTTMNGANAGKNFVRFYAAGSDFNNQADVKAAGQVAGALSNIVIKPNLLGPSTAPIAIFGSGDGWLYAVDVCKATLAWGYNFHASVGAPILADTNGDGKDEIIVGAADGYVYDLRLKIVDPPAAVFDTDSSLKCSELAGRVTQSRDTLYACWSAVGGATSYSYAVYSGTTLVADFQDTPKTSATIGGLMLTPGKHYQIAVRASSPVGSSVETLSPGILVAVPAMADMMASASDMGMSSADLLMSQPGMDMTSGQPKADMSAAITPAASGGCGCAVGGASGFPVGATALIAGLALLMLRRRRARR